MIKLTGSSLQKGWYNPILNFVLIPKGTGKYIEHWDRRRGLEDIKKQRETERRERERERERISNLCDQPLLKNCHTLKIEAEN